ncbi:hypothetical protein JCM10213_008140 [Rhodosporidiobolus nylandii]
MSTSHPTASSASSPAIASASTSVDAFAFENAKLLGQEENEDEKPRVKEEEDEAYLLSPFSRRDKGSKREDAPSPAPEHGNAVKLDHDEHDKPPVKEEEDAKPLVKDDDDDRATLSRREEGIKRETAPSPAPKDEDKPKTEQEEGHATPPPEPKGLEDEELDDADFATPGTSRYHESIWLLKAAKRAGFLWTKVVYDFAYLGDEKFDFEQATSAGFECEKAWRDWLRPFRETQRGEHPLSRRIFRYDINLELTERMHRLYPLEPRSAFVGPAVFRQKREAYDVQSNRAVRAAKRAKLRK